MDTRLFDALAGAAEKTKEKVLQFIEAMEEILPQRQRRIDEAIYLIQWLTGAPPADMDKIRCSGLSIHFCIAAAKAGFSVPEILEAGRTGLSLDSVISLKRKISQSFAINELLQPATTGGQLTGARPKLPLNQRQLWRRRRSRGRGTKGGARK